MTMHERTKPLVRAIAALALVVALSPARSAPAQQPDYVVGARDVLNITVWDQPTLSGKFTVEADGTFTYPFIGRVKAAGLRLRDLESGLKRQLADGYVKDPQLSVTVEQYQSQTVQVLGEVKLPGVYPLTGQMSLIEALARAGSTTENASTTAIVTHRGARPAVVGTSGTTSPAPATDAVRVNLKALQSGALDQNVQLRDGDVVFVPRAEKIFVYGQVKLPGSYAIQDGMTVMQAIAVAGGLTERGSTGRLRIERQVNGVKKQVKVKLDDLVLPGDTIVVGERLF